MKTLLILAKDGPVLTSGIPWDSLGIRPVYPGKDEFQADALLCDEGSFVGSEGLNLPVILLTHNDPEMEDVIAVAPSQSTEPLMAALRKLMIFLNICQANELYCSGPREVFQEELPNMSAEAFWENVLVDSSCLRSSEEYMAASARCGDRLLQGQQYVLSMFMIYSHKARFTSWKPNTLESVAKALLAEVMDCRDIPVIEINRTQYFTINKFRPGQDPQIFSRCCDLVTERFLDSWGMNVFAMASVPTEVEGLWRQRLRLVLEFDSFYSNIGRNAATTLVENVRYLVEQSEEQVPSRGELAQRLGFNPDYLSRIFHQQSGKTLVDYLEEVRLRRAKRLLYDRGIPISEIASRLGYQNFSSFTQMFRRNTGMTPSQFRKSLNSVTKEQ